MFYYLCSSLFHRDTHTHTHTENTHREHTQLQNEPYISNYSIFAPFSQITQTRYISNTQHTSYMLSMIYASEEEEETNATHHKYKATFED